MRLSTRVATIAASLIVLCIAAVPALAARSHAHATAVTVTASEFKFKLSKASVPAGSVTFSVTNKGKIPHDFKIAGKKTPLLKPGKSAKLTVKLKKGKNAYVCSVAGHAALGMKGSLTAKWLGPSRPGSRPGRLDLNRCVERAVAVVHEVRGCDHLETKRPVVRLVDPGREPRRRRRVEERDDPHRAAADLRRPKDVCVRRS